MNTIFRFLLAAIALFATGCAAPMSKVVSTRPGETIDQHLFKEGDKVKVTYEDEHAKMKTKKGRVLHTDDDSVTLDVGVKGPIDLEYRRIHTFSRPIRVDRWFGSLSAGTFIALEEIPQELPGFIRFTGAGSTLRYAPYSNRAFEANFLMGSKKRWKRFSKWLAMTLSVHVYTIIPHTYFILGLGGIVWPLPTEWYAGHEPKNPGLIRMGFGVEKPILKRFNVRIEAELIGLRVHLEQRIH